MTNRNAQFIAFEFVLVFLFWTEPYQGKANSLALAQFSRGHRHVATGSKCGSVCILSINAFSCHVPFQASRSPLPLGFKFLQNRPRFY